MEKFELKERTFEDQNGYFKCTLKLIVDGKEIIEHWNINDSLFNLFKNNNIQPVYSGTDINSPAEFFSARRSYLESNATIKL